LSTPAASTAFWASIGPHLPQTAYAAAKFAVKGFTEALINDLRINAPHIKCSVVMPGHIGTSIPLNTRKVQSGNQADTMDETQLAQARARFASMGGDTSAMSGDQIRQRVAERERRFREEGADQRRGSGDDHSQWGQGRPLAHSGRARLA
jgi:NAD(P)-dependent dehydrogenase (short-subunit alcohol dehydrogenase family)